MPGCDSAPTAVAGAGADAAGKVNDGSCARIADSNRRSSGPGSRPSSSTKQVATLLEDPKGIGLAPGAVQRQHQQPTKPLAQRMGGDELLELDDRSLVTAELELEVEPLLEQREPQTRTTG